MAVKTQRGIALIVVLWMIMIMMTLAASLLYATRTQSSMLDYSQNKWLKPGLLLMRLCNTPFCNCIYLIRIGSCRLGGGALVYNLKEQK